MPRSALFGQPPSRPATCATCEQMLPLLVSGGLEPWQHQWAQAHVDGCAACQRARAQYERLVTVMRARYAVGGAAVGARTHALAGVIAAAGADGAQPLWQRLADIWRGLRWSGHPRVALNVLATALLVLLFVTAFGAHLRNRDAATAPVLDGPSQAYLQMLRADYAPLVAANTVPQRCWGAADPFSNKDAPPLTPAEVAQEMHLCRQPLVNELTAAHAFGAQLAATRPPAAWRPLHHGFVQATNTLIRDVAMQIAVIDANQVSQIPVTMDTVAGDLALFNAPVNDINQRIHAGPPPLPAPVPLMAIVY